MSRRFVVLVSALALVSMSAVLVFAGGGYQKVSTYSQSGGYSEYEICAAAISTVFFKPVNIMSVKTDDEEVYLVKYVRPNDGSVWTNKCKIEGTRIIWGSKDGRWRMHPNDSVLSYSASGEKLTVTERYGDGSSSKKVFSKSDFK